MPKRGEYKIHTCCICHKTLAVKPHRLVYQEYNECGRNHQYQNLYNYDFCDECFMIFKKWINKHKRGD